MANRKYKKKKNLSPERRTGKGESMWAFKENTKNESLQ